MVLALATAAVWYAVYAQTPRGALVFATLNIGQGDALYIESPTGVSVLLDGGPDASVLSELSKVMLPFDRTIDAVIESHPDADHIAGLVDVLARYHVGAFIEPGIPDSTATSKALEQEVADEKIPHYIARRGMLLDLGGGAYLQILFPDYDVSHLPSTKTNEGAIVARLIYGKTSVMLTADAPFSTEDHLLALDGGGLQSDILKVGHHGSKYSTGSAFVAAVHPSLAVISVGANNKYGHPSQLALDTLASFHIPILRTDQDGTLIFESNGQEFWRMP